MKNLLTIALLTLGSISAMAQSKFNVSGSVVEKGTNEAVISATVRILSLPDSSMVNGAATDATGAFTVKDVKKGKYAVKVTYIGYQDKVIGLDLTNKKDKNVSLGVIAIDPDSKLLKEAKVTANAAKVQVSGDSIIYNAAAYHVAEGSVLEDLVKKLPGAQVGEDGKIKMNGKEVNKILVGGKEFFLNDTETALKNLPTDMIENIKTYDRKSDLARVTGIDDGEEETVIDLTVKKGMAQGWMGNLNLGAGTKERYSNRLYAQRQTENAQIQLVGGMNNIGSRGFGGGGGRGGWGGFGGGGGLRTNKDIGLNWGTAADKLETSGSVRYRYNGSDTRSETSSEDFVNKAGAFSNRNSVSLSSNSGVNANFRLEWKPDSMTNIIFRPAGSYSRNRGFSDNISASFKEDPYSYTQDPLSNLNDEVLKNVLVNSNIQTQQTYSNNSSMNGELQLNRRLNKEGRNITLRLTGSLGSSSSKQLSASDIKYYGTGISMPNNNNRYYDTPGRNSSYSIQATYSEPIAYRTYLQFSYRYNYSYTKNDRQAFTYKAEAYNEMENLLHRYRYNVAGIVDHLLSLSEDNPLYKSTFDNSLSQYSEYNNYNHTATIMLRRTRDNYNFSIGIDLMPQRSHLDYKYLQTDTTVTRNVFNFAPRIDLRYKFNKTTNLQIGYNGRSSQPSMTNLLDIKDDSNPLNVTRGNTGLKPSFTHTVHAFFNTFQMEHQTNFFANVFGNIMQNSISNQMSYDEATGVRYTRPMNINGNWSVSGGFGGNTGVDRDNKFTIGSFSNVSYNNSVGFLGSGNNDNMGAKQTTKALNLSENLEFGYRDEWFDISLNGGITYNRSRNNQNKANNLDTYQFSYGSEIDVRTPIGLNFHTDISMQSRRGYAQESMNTNELLWNAQVSKSLLKGNALTISLEVNDILGRQSNISRTITALSRTDSRYNAIYQYGMLHAIYRLNIFGGKGARGGQGGGRGGWGGGFPGGGFPGGGFGGGFGGGRPGGRM